eukprot:SAG31_NODE_2600_length_5414_cov_3.077140_1_plen_294_part_00
MRVEARAAVAIRDNFSGGWSRITDGAWSWLCLDCSPEATRGMVRLTASACTRAPGEPGRWMPLQNSSQRPITLAVVPAPTFSLVFVTRSSLSLRFRKPAIDATERTFHCSRGIDEVDCALQFASPADCAKFRASCAALCSAVRPDWMAKAGKHQEIENEGGIRVELRRDPQAGYGISLAVAGESGQEQVLVRSVSIPGPAAEAGVCAGYEVRAVSGVPVHGLPHPEGLTRLAKELAKVPKSNAPNEPGPAVYWDFRAPQPECRTPLLEGFSARLVSLSAPMHRLRICIGRHRN